MSLWKTSDPLGGAIFYPKAIIWTILLEVYKVKLHTKYQRPRPSSFSTTKTCLYNFDTLKPHFYIVKLGFTGVYIIFLISTQKHRLLYSLEPPHRCGSNEYPQPMFWAEVWKLSEFFLSENFQFLELKFSIYLNRCVFVMDKKIFKVLPKESM